MNTLGARDFSRAVSGFLGLRPKMYRPSPNTENSHRTREKPLVPRVGMKGGKHQTGIQRCCSPWEIA